MSSLRPLPGGQAGAQTDRGPIVLDLVHLSRRFGHTLAVDDANLRIEAGEMTGVIGRSGAGKSTLLRLINRLIEPSEGSILADGVDITRLRGRALREWRARTAMIFQQFNLVNRLDVLTNVLIGGLVDVPAPRMLLRLFTEAELRLTAAPGPGAAGRPVGGRCPFFGLFQDVEDDTRLCLGVGPAVIAPAAEAGPLGFGVAQAGPRMSPQIVAEEQVVAFPMAASCTHVHVHIAPLACGRPEEPVQFVPAAQHKAGCLQLRNVARLDA